MSPSRQTLALARATFFADNDFGLDGGYDDAWSEAVFGTVPYRVPNPRIRGEALRLHDLHHLATGYATDWRGESEISAWELGSGGAGSTTYAWVIALWGLFTGLVALPKRMFTAFVRGRRSDNLYGQPFRPEMLGWTVGELEARLGVTERASARPADVLAFAAWSAVAVGFGLVSSVFAFALVSTAWLRSLAPCCPLSCPGATPA
ncbi:MAG: hypothetical protein GY884_19875 [Proteobacteria bacterium]|nr:hypothetical protein [Pseudomonadota bacterium]